MIVGSTLWQVTGADRSKLGVQPRREPAQPQTLRRLRRVGVRTKQGVQDEDQSDGIGNVDGKG